MQLKYSIQNKMKFAINLTIMHRMSVCLSALSSTFCIARLWTPTVAFESLGIRYPPPSMGKMRVGVELPGLLPPLILPNPITPAPGGALLVKTIPERQSLQLKRWQYGNKIQPENENERQN